MTFKKICLCILSIGLLTPITSAWAEEGVLRIFCRDANSEAMIHINGKNKGLCDDGQLTFFLPKGKVELKAIKSIDSDHERTFEKTFYLDDMERVTVNLSSTQLTARAAARIAKEQQTADKNAAGNALKLARQGDVAAMKKIASLYAIGKGVEKDAENAQYWLDKAEFTKTLKLAKTGNIEAIETLTGFYQTGKGVKKSAAQVTIWKKAKIQAIQKQKESEAAIVLKNAKAGNISSMRDMAKRYNDGNGVPKSSTVAETWLIKASNAERKKAIEATLARQDGLPIFHGIQRTMQNRPDIGMLRSISVSIMPTALTMDLVASPTRRAEANKLRKELESLAATWDSPNSMVAKAYNSSIQ